MDLQCNFLKYFDIFGYEFQFNIGKDKMLKTRFGGFIAIFMVVSLVPLAWYFGKDIEKREEPNFIEEKTMQEDFPFWNATSKNFFFAYKVYDFDFKNINDPRYFEFLFEYEKWRTDNVTFERKEFYNHFETPRKCNLSNLDLDDKYYAQRVFDNEKLGEFLCVNSNFTIGGDWSRGVINFPNFMVLRCNNNTKKKYNITRLGRRSKKKV